jgi:tetratricopeptide (TPR) repeat protein
MHQTGFKCPACGGSCAPRESCLGCGADLTPLCAVLNGAHKLAKEAADASVAREFAVAAEAARRSLLLWQGNEQTWALLALSLCGLGRLADAEAVLERATKRFHNGRCESLLKAVTEARRIVASNPVAAARDEPPAPTEEDPVGTVKGQDRAHARASVLRPVGAGFAAGMITMAFAALNLMPLARGPETSVAPPAVVAADAAASAMSPEPGPQPDPRPVPARGGSPSGPIYANDWLIAAGEHFYRAGRAAARRGDLREAELAYHRAAQAPPKAYYTDDAAYYRARTLERLRDPRAVEAYRLLIDRFPDSLYRPHAEEALRRLEAQVERNVEPDGLAGDGPDEP